MIDGRSTSATPVGSSACRSASMLSARPIRRVEIDASTSPGKYTPAERGN